MMGGYTTSRAAILLANHVTASGSYAWVSYPNVAHMEGIDLQASFYGSELHTISMVATKGNIIQSVGDPSSIALTLTPPMDVEVTPVLSEAVRAPKGVRFIAAGLRRLQDWCSFLSALVDAPPSTQPKLLSYSGHGNVSILISDTPLVEVLLPL